jgi:hypothetical protein
MRARIAVLCAAAFACGGKQNSAECLFGQSSEACEGGGGGGLHEPPERQFERDLAACERDEVSACDHLYFHRAVVPAVHAPAIAKGLRHGCEDLLSAMSCLHLALAARRDGDPALTREMLERSCKLGLERDTKEAVRVGCSEQAALHWAGTDGKRDPEAARALWGEAYRHLTKDPRWPRLTTPCLELGRVSLAPPTAGASHVAACKAGDVTECSEVGIAVANAQPQ